MDALNDEKLADGKSQEMWKYVLNVELRMIKEYTNIIINVEKLVGTLPLFFFIIILTTNIEIYMKKGNK